MSNMDDLNETQLRAEYDQACVMCDKAWRSYQAAPDREKAEWFRTHQWALEHRREALAALEGSVV